mgnify:FL=1
MLHLAEMAWHRPTAPTEYCTIGQQLELVVLSIDVANRNVALGLKQLAPSPWDTHGQELVEGSEVDGTVTSFQAYGAFLEVTYGMAGLLHHSNISWDRQPKPPQDYLRIGQRLRCRILSVDVAKEKLELGLKQLTPSPWETIGPTLSVGSEIEGTIINLLNYGAFIEVAPGVDGLLHLSNLSWVKRISHPNECLQIGQQLRCRILRVDVEKQELEVGLKQLTSNPWEERIPRQYLAEMWIDGRVAKVTNFGLFVELEPDLEGLLHVSEIPEDRADPKELTQHFEIGQMLRVRILSVDVNEQKIALSLKPSET